MENNENKIVVKYNVAYLVISLLVGIVLTFIGIVILNIYFNRGDGIALLGGLSSIAFGAGVIWLDVDKFKRRVILIIDENGVNLIRDNTELSWNEIRCLSIQEEIVHGRRSTYKRVNFSCFLLNGFQMKTDVSNSDYSSKKLYQAITTQFPQVKCYPANVEPDLEDENIDPALSEKITDLGDSSNSSSSKANFVQSQEANYSSDSPQSKSPESDNRNSIRHSSKVKDKSDSVNSKSAKAKRMLKGLLKEVCYCIAPAYIIFCVAVHVMGITFDSQTSINLLEWTGGAAFGGIALFYLNDKIQSVRSKIILFIVIAGGVAILTTITFPMLHIYNVTSQGHRDEVEYLRSLGKANVGEVHFSSKEGRYFVVNSTDESLYLLARLYNIIGTTSYDKGKGHVEYTYTGVAADGGNSGYATENDLIMGFITPHTYFPLPLEFFSKTKDLMNPKFGPPSTKYSITTEEHGFDSFYVYFLMKAPKVTNPEDNERTKNEEMNEKPVNDKGENNEPVKSTKTKTPIREWNSWDM